jgi:homospermidine synthase
MYKLLPLGTFFASSKTASTLTNVSSSHFIIYLEDAVRTCEQRTKDIKCNDLCRITYKLILISSICIYSKTHPIFTDGYSFQDNEIIVINVRHNNNISKKLCFFLQFNIHFLSCMLSKYQFKRYLIISK